MKVLVFTSLYPNNIWPNHGVFVKERMTHFAKVSGCEVKVVAPVPYFPPLKINSRWLFSQVARKERIEGIEVYHPRYLMTPKFGMITYGFLMFLSSIQTLKRLKESFDFDLIDSHFVYPDGFAAVLLGKLFNKPVVVSARGSDINLYRQFPMIRKILQYTLNNANRVIAVCEALKQAMLSLPIIEDNISVIPNGVDEGKFFPYSKEQARQTLGLPHKKIICSVGALIPLKGHHHLIQAFKNLADSYREENVCLVIIGEGPSRKYLQTLISSLNLSSQIKLVGSISHQDLYLWYSAADVFCLASSREGWPNVILESLACATPVVATEVGGIPEIIRSDKIGLLTKTNEECLSKSLRLALSKEWEPEAIVHYARQHTWIGVASSVSAVFTSAMSNHGGVKNSTEHL